MFPLVLLLLLIANTSVVARDLPSAKPAREGLSADRLARIDAHMNQAVSDGIMVGGLGMISRNGKVVYNNTWGLSDRESNTAMERDAIFRIYSMSKPVTAVALMMLYEEGRFFLNDPVAKYLPELANLRVAVATADGDAGVVSDGTVSEAVGAAEESASGATRAPARQPTIRDLLRHTAGFTYGIFGDTEVDRAYREAALFEQPSIEEFVRTLGTLPLQYEPGTRWHYSVAVDVQGRLVEVLSGMRFGDYLQQRIFAPLGMTDTSFLLPENKRDRLAKLYAPKGSSAGPNQVWQRSASSELEPAAEAASNSFTSGRGFESGGGGLVSTASDYMRFCLMLLNGGELNGVRLLSPRTVELMTMNHSADLPVAWGQAGVGFGLGVAILLDPGQVGELGSAGEYSWGGAAGTRFWIDPKENIAGVFMVQSLPHQTRLGHEFRVLTYQAIID